MVAGIPSSAGGQCHALGVIARRERDHAGARAPGARRDQAVVGAAELERAAALERLALEEHVAPTRSSSVREVTTGVRFATPAMRWAALTDVVEADGSSPWQC